MLPGPGTATAKRAARDRRQGVSLMEVVISTLLVGLVLVASLKAVGGIFRTWSASEQRHDGMGLAQQLMTEILQQHYNEPDGVPVLGVEVPESTLDRSSWDDVDDYNGWSSVPQDKTGTALAGYGGWTRAAAVEYVQIADPTQTSATDTGLKRITVTVTDPSGRQTVLDSYRSQWGMLEQAPDADATLQTWITNELQIGASLKLQTGVHVLNHAEDQ